MKETLTFAGGFLFGWLAYHGIHVSRSRLLSSRLRSTMLFAAIALGLGAVRTVDHTAHPAWDGAAMVFGLLSLLCAFERRRDES